MELIEAIRWMDEQRSMPSFVAGFDSTTTLLRAQARFLHGEDFPALGLAPRSIASLLPAGNALPRTVRQRLYRIGTAFEAIEPAELESVQFEDVRRWVTNIYQTRGYPAVVVGSTNGAAIHLAALLGIPWLPQTFLVPVRRNRDPDDARAELKWSKRHGPALLDGNPDVALHHMHDPNQDRIPLKRMAYFRVKTRRLGPAYEQFLRTILAPRGVIILLECTDQWPVTEIDDRHFFQFGGVGKLTPQEYLNGTNRVSMFLRSQGSDRSRWDPPETDSRQPEAEWGFDPSLRDDVVRFATAHDYRIRRLRFDSPVDLSSLVANLYRERYADDGHYDRRLLVNTFAQVDPWWTLRTGSVPFWLPFTTTDDARSLEKYLEQTPDQFAEIYLSLFSHGLESLGTASIARWQLILDRAGSRGTFVGVDSERYPIDYGTYVRYNGNMAETIPARRPITSPMQFSVFEEWMEAAPSCEPVQWLSPFGSTNGPS